MGYGYDYWGLYRDYYRDPFSHSLLSTRQTFRMLSDLRYSIVNKLGGPSPTAVGNSCLDISKSPKNRRPRTLGFSVGALIVRVVSRSVEPWCLFGRVVF